MGWGRISDNMHEHRKVVELTQDALEGTGLEGLAAFGLWSECLSWVRADYSRVGVVPAGQAVRFGGKFAKQLASLLVQVGLWDEVPGGWRFHDYEVVYPSQDLSEKRAEAGRKGGEASGRTRQKAAAEAKSKQLASDGEANTNQNDDFSRARARAATAPLIPLITTTGPSAANGRNVREAERGQPGPTEQILAGWIGSLRVPPQQRMVDDVGRHVAAAIRDGLPAEGVAEAVGVWEARGGLGPGALPAIIHEVTQRGAPVAAGSALQVVRGRASPPGSTLATSDQRVQDALAAGERVQAAFDARAAATAAGVGR